MNRLAIAMAGNFGAQVVYVSIGGEPAEALEWLAWWGIVIVAAIALRRVLEPVEAPR